eukprot:TRINITY_DN2508_c0_g1_i1.p1 TRINITY_DN2508_c0_g1~~TRINITY_DN2508_c0_g1_i1.p1  ORF type:complete len:397 (+),score=77.97 TRINITY_DN2508_c0_g1_i1:86-1276(+)
MFARVVSAASIIAGCFVGMPEAKPVPLIIDTDMSTDVDDVTALCMAHELDSRGEAHLLGVVHDTGLYQGIGAVSVINHFYGRDDLALGAYKGTFDNGSEILAEGNWQSTGGVSTGSGAKTIKKTDGPYVKQLVKQFPSPVKNYSQVPDAVKVYRKLLAAQPDHSVVIASIGFLTNLADLLRSGSDAESHLSGVDLVAAKVKQVFVMGGSYPNSSHLFDDVEHEWNFGGGCNWSAPVCPTTREATSYFMKHWPSAVPRVFLGFKVGVKILNGEVFLKPDICPAVADGQPLNPCAEAFKAYKPWNLEFWPNRPSWDPATVLIAVRGLSPFFEVQSAGHNAVNPADGSNAWIAQDADEERSQQSFVKYVNDTIGPDAVAQAINELICSPRRPKASQLRR